MLCVVLQVMHDILANYPASNGIVAVARFAISFVVMCCYPLQAHPTRACITTIVKKTCGKGGTLNENFVHYAITTVFVATTATIAFLVEDLGLVLSVVGATGSTIVSYILPGLCYFLLFPGRNTRYIGLLILCAGLTFMTVSLYLIFFGASLGHRRMLAAY
jgi:amino acid permease